MNINEMHSWFDILQMKGHNVEFTRREKDHLINRAQLKYVNEVLQKKYLPSLQGNEKSKIINSPVESIISGRDALKPLLGTVVLTSSGGSASIEYADIENEINTELQTSLSKDASFKSKLMMITGVRHTNGIMCRWLSSVDTAKNIWNVYRQAEEFQPWYTLQEHQVNITPNTLGGDDFSIYYIREPELVKWAYESSDRVNCELPNYTHDEIMAIALDDAGVAQRDQALMQLNKANKENLSENF
tara:strand:+ start:35 stop:766 length:732 start_codon:yes stop_codon:yes gene_type:complete